MYPEQSPEALSVITETAERKHNRLVVPDMSACRVVDETVHGTDVIFDSLKLHIPFAGDHMIKKCADGRHRRARMRSERR